VDQGGGSVQLGGGLQNSHPAAAIRIDARPIAEGHPKIDAQRRIDAGELRRSDADYRVGVRFGADGLAEHRGVAVEQVLPGVIADDRDRLVLAREPAAQSRAQTQHGGVIAGDRLGADEHRVAFEAEVGLLRLGHGQPLQGLVAIAQGTILRVGQIGIAAAAEDGHAIGVSHRQGPEIERIEQAEDGGIHSDSERQAEQRQKGEAWRFAEQPNREGEVVHGGYDTGGGAIVPALARQAAIIRIFTAETRRR